MVWSMLIFRLAVVTTHGSEHGMNLLSFWLDHQSPKYGNVLVTCVANMAETNKPGLSLIEFGVLV